MVRRVTATTPVKAQPCMSLVSLRYMRPLLQFGVAVALSTAGCNKQDPVDPEIPIQPGPQNLVTSTVASGFDTIWDLAWGPDNAIWVTERGGIISRVNPATGSISRAGTLPVNENGEGGLMGLTFHPDFATNPTVFAVHTYAAAGNATRNRVVRMSWSGSSLGTPQVLVDNIPGSSVHNGARVVVGPDRLLYVSMGDAANTSLPQQQGSPAGKILRFALDGTPAPGNPFGNAVYSLGHRNPQGLVFAPDGTLYSTEHGPGDNDEVNRIEAGRNYGWPTVRGKCDNDIGTDETAFCTANNVVEPLANWTPTIAPAGLDYYNSDLIAAWKGSLLFTTLKGSALHRMKLSADGRSIVSQEVLFQGEFGRMRDVLVGPDGSVYLGTSNRDGRGSPAPQDDRIIRVRPE